MIGYFISNYDMDELREIELAMESEMCKDLSEELSKILDSATPVELDIKTEEQP